MLGALALVPAALGGSLSGSVQIDPPPAVDLPSAGAIDWAIWGYAGEGTSATLTPDVRKAGGKAISALTNIDPAPSAPLRGLGQFDGPYAFSWTNGAPTGSATGARAGLQHNGGPPPSPLGVDVSTLGKGFSFDVPAGTGLRTLRVYVATNRAAGTLTASLSDGSAANFVDTLPAAVDLRSGIYTLTYAASSSGQTLHVSWVETQDNCAAFRCDNAAIYAVALSAPIVVNTSADHDDGLCDAADCTLREAIGAANDLGGGTIAFAIPSDGPATITTTLAPLPVLTAPVEIDGTTQAAAPGTLGVSIDGGSIGGNGLVLGPGSSGSTIRGLALRGFRQVIIEGLPGPPIFAGIVVQSNDNTIAQNFVGTTYDGSEAGARKNERGIVVTGNGNVVSGNLVSGSTSYGILVDGSTGAHDNVISSNLVGTNATGNAPLPNEIGIGTTGGAVHTLIGGNTADEGNVVFGAENSIDLQGVAGVPDNSEIRFNNVGVGKDGTTALGTSFAWAVGVNNADGVIIADNVVGNGESGLALANSNDLIVVRNLIGVDRNDGNQGNTNEGIDVQSANGGKRPQHVLVAENTIRFNGFEGIIVSNADRTTVSGNIVVDNGEGVSVSGDHNTIGPGNTVHDNFLSDTGIAVYAGVGNTITQNSIYGNQGLGIDLVQDVNGVTPNDAGDADVGANGFQNFPALASASADGASLDLAYTLDSLPNAAYTIEFFALTGCDGSGNGEGAIYLGSRQVKLGAGPGSFSATLTGPGVVGLNSDQSITATATDGNGSTSEFSACRPVTVAGTLAGLRLTSDDPAVPAGAANVPLAAVPPALLGAFAFAPIPNSPIPNSGVGAAPIPNSPIPNSPIPNSPIPNSPIPNSPIPNSGLDGIPAALLANVLLSSIPIDWNAIFVAPDPNAGVPVTSLTLADLYRDSAALARFNNLKLGQLQLQNTLLRGARFVSFLFGATKLRYIPPFSQAAWCAAVSKPAACADLDVASTTVLGLDVAGLLDDTQIARLGGLTVGEITDPGPPVTPIPNSPIPNSPIPNSPIPNSPIPNSPIPNSSLSLTAIGSIVVGSLYNPPAVVDCTRFTSTAVCLAKTLSEASAAGAMKSTATFADLAFPKIGSTVSPLAHINFNAFSVGLIGLENLPWESWPFAGFQQFAGTGDVVHYHLTAPVPCGTSYQLRAVLPNGFIVKAGTSALAVGAGSAKTVADPAQDADGATWSVLPQATGCVGGGNQTVRLDFQALAGFRLGEQTSIVRLTVGSSTSAATAQAPVTVTQTNEPDGDPANAPAIQPNALAIGHIGTSGDLDWRSLSTTGMAPGTKIQVFMRPPAGTDLDVFLTKPSAQSLLASPIPNSPIPNSPIPNSALPDNGRSLNTSTDNPQPEGLQDAPIPNSTIAASGHTRGDGVEVAQVTLAGDENGPVKIVVDGYNGDFSNDAYTLRVKVITPPQLPACPARVFPFPTGTVGTLPASIPADTGALMLFNYSATASMYGQTAATALRDRLNAFVAAHPALKAVVLQVDGDAAVRAAKAAWDASPCVPNAANDVVRKVNALVARYRGGAQTIENVVIVGGDELMPMARIPDLTTDANESSAVSDLLFTTNGLTRGNALFASEFLGNTLTDDAYTAGATIPWFGRELYLPQLAGGRLVETPAEITRQLDAFDASNGILDPGTGVVAGYDFMRDEATQVKSELGSRRNAAGSPLTIDASNPLLLTSGAPFISSFDSWGKADVEPYFAASTLAPGIMSVNGHYNHWELAPATSPITASTLVPSSVLPGSARLANAILFTMGCHAGLNVSDSFPSTTDTTVRLRDWAQALAQNGAGVYVANTGYGYGDFDTIALSERLMTMFAHNLASDGSIGRKLVLAKQQYFASIASYDPYAEKALAEATFYGLPFYRLGSGPEPAPAPLLTPAPTTTPNVAAAPLIFSFTGADALVAHSTPRGKYWSAADGGVEYLKDRPIEPRVSREVTAVGTQRAHGVLIDALQTHDIPGSIDPLIATPMIDLAAHEPESKVTDVTFPATFASLNHWTAFGQNHDQLVVVPGQTREGTTQRLVDSIDVRVLYSNSTDFTAPLFTQVGSVVNGSTATLFARTSDASGIPVVKAYFTQGGSSWTFVTLTQQGTSDLYVGTATGITVPKLESAFLAEDGAGNVGYTTDKGFLFISQNGDGRGPQVTIASPINHGVFTLGQPVPASFSCFDDGGVASCTGTKPVGENVDTSTVGQKTFSVTSKDLSGNTTTVTATYTVIYKFNGFFQPVDNLPALNGLNAGQSVPIRFTLDGNQGLLIFAAGSPSSIPIACDATAPIDQVEQTLTTSTSSLNYDSGSGQYNYVWKTEKSWAGSCRQLSLAFKDGTVHVANFKFK